MIKKRGKTRFRRKSVCYFSKNKIKHIDYKDVELLKRFITKSFEITPRSMTGTKNKYQKYLSKAIKRARFLGLLRYPGQEPKNLFKTNIVSNNLQTTEETVVSNQQTEKQVKKEEK